MAKKLNKRRALALLEEASLLAQRGEWQRVTTSMQEVVASGELRETAPVTLLSDALTQLGRRDEALLALEDGLRRFPRRPELEARLASALLERDEVQRALVLFERARPTLRRDPSFLTHYALALLRGGKTEAAEGQLAVALLTGGGLETRLVMALAKGRRGAFEEAEALAATVEAQAEDERLKFSARAVRADCRLMQGDAAGGLALWKEVQSAGQLDASQLAHMAWAAQLAGDLPLADSLVAERTAHGPTAEDRLLFAQISVARGQAEQALVHLDALGSAPGERGPGSEYEALSTRGRALRVLGRSAEARAVLEAAAARAEVGTRRLGPPVLIDLGHLAAEQGDFEAADALFARALALDPDEPEARRARELSARRVAWREELAASAEARVDAARAEAESLKRRFLSRESELDALKRELATVKAAQATAEQRATAAAEDAKAAEERAQAAQQRRLREELEARERDVEHKAKANLELALGTATCPDAIWQMLLVAERTYQKALYTELPAAAVAVLFSGALERSLFLLLVAGFDAWLVHGGRRAAFLNGAIRERRGRRVEYFDHFVEAFDKQLEGRAPALGEVGRVLERRHEAYLSPFREFLIETFALEEAFYDRLADFVQWSKERLRDPVAHGRGIELGYDELKRFREKLLFRFDDREPGVLPALLRARR